VLTTHSLFRPAPLLLAMASFAGASGILAPTPVVAAEDDDDDDDEFDTSHLGARLGIWYRPEFDLRGQIGGVTPPGTGVSSPPTVFDVHTDLGVTETAMSDYMFQNGILEAEIFIDSRWITVSVSGVAPFRYEGETNLSRSITFGGISFAQNVNIESRFEQWTAGVELRVHLLNNRFIRLSPLVAVRALSIDWEVEASTSGVLGSSGLKGDTSDISSPLEFGDDQVIPYIEIGAEVRVGWRDLIEADLKLSGLVVDYLGVEGGTINFDAGITAYPTYFIPNSPIDIGLRLGVRYIEWDLKAKDSVLNPIGGTMGFSNDDRDDLFDLDLEYLGFNMSLIIRFG
jgi:hypothetical protein